MTVSLAGPQGWAMGEGNDILSGIEDIRTGAGDDVLIGSADQNWLDGGEGNDTLTGGGGADVFYFNQYSGHDEVVDFQAGVDGLKLFWAFAERFRDLTLEQTAEGVMVSSPFAYPQAQVLLRDVLLQDLTARDFDLSHDLIG